MFFILSVDYSLYVCVHSAKEIVHTYIGEQHCREEENAEYVEAAGACQQGNRPCVKGLGTEQ